MSAAIHVPAAEAGRPLPAVRFWNRSFLALVMAPEFPMSDWFAALDRQLASAPGFFRCRPIVLDLSGVGEDAPNAGPILVEGLEARELRLVGMEGADPSIFAGTPWARLATLPGRDLPPEPGAAAAPEVPATPSALLIDQPVRSGQSIVFEAGDVTVVGSVASGAEVIAGGSIHVYGRLRGRAIAGLRSGAGARIFCRRLEAELVGVDRLYRTADHWGPKLHGRAAQVFCDQDGLHLSPLV